MFGLPIVLREYRDKKGLQYNIPYQRHLAFFNDVIISVQNQTPIPFDGNISLKKIISVLDAYSQTSPLSFAPNSYLQAALQEAKLKIALFVDVEEAELILAQIKERSWDTKHFEAFGVDFGIWFQSLRAVISGRNEFLNQIEANWQDKKVLKLKRAELTV